MKRFTPFSLALFCLALGFAQLSCAQSTGGQPNTLVDGKAVADGKVEKNPNQGVSVVVELEEDVGVFSKRGRTKEDS